MHTVCLVNVCEGYLIGITYLNTGLDHVPLFIEFPIYFVIIQTQNR